MVPERTSSVSHPSAATTPLDLDVSVSHCLHACSAKMACALISTGVRAETPSVALRKHILLATRDAVRSRFCKSPRGGPQQQRQHAHPSA